MNHPGCQLASAGISRFLAYPCRWLEAERLSPSLPLPDASLVRCHPFGGNEARVYHHPRPLQNRRFLVQRTPSGQRLSQSNLVGVLEIPATRQPESQARDNHVKR